MKHFGDVTKLNGTELPIVDIITGGSPCQDLSVAGKRAGLAGERSGLFMDQIRIIKEMRDEDKRRRCGITGADEYIRPRYMVWENVPGAFSSNKGEDFRAVLEETAKVADENAVIPEPPKGKWTHAGCIVGNGWSIAWRLHDSQWWGVPQRRKRICLLADFNGDTAGRILFELQRKTPESDTEQAIVDIGTESRSEVQSVSKGLSGDIAESREEGERTTEDVERSVGETSAVVQGADMYNGSLTGEVAATLNATSGDSPTHSGPSVVCLENHPSDSRVKIREEGQRIAEDTERCAGEAGKCLNSLDVQSKHIQPENGVAEPLYAGECRGGGGEQYVMQNQPIAFEPGAMSRVGGHAYEDIAGTVRANAGDNQQAIVYGIGSYDSNAMKSDNPKSGIYQADTSRTLDLNGGNPGCNQGGMAVVHCVDQGGGKSQCGVSEDVSPTLATTHGGEPVICLEGNGQRNGHRENGFVESDTMYTLNTVEQHAVCIENHPADSRVKIADDYKEPQCVAYGLDRASYNQGQNAKFNFAVDKEKVGTCVAKDPNAVFQSVVRRLTPLECERLQNFPDHWTDIGEWYDSKGKKHKDADSPRYKALGNSIALPFWQYLADKMCAYLNKPTMASLFDGIGGFPLVFTRAGAKAVWGSEVDEFCIAVSKKHFPDNEYTVAISYLESRGL